MRKFEFIKYEIGIPAFEHTRYGIFKIWHTRCWIYPELNFEDLASEKLPKIDLACQILNSQSIKFSVLGTPGTKVPKIEFYQILNLPKIAILQALSWDLCVPIFMMYAVLGSNEVFATH